MIADDLKEFADGKWKGLDKYACPYCAFDSINETLFREHLQQHAQRVSPNKISVHLVDRYGNAVAIQETGEDSKDG